MYKNSEKSVSIPWRISVAPMMKWTTRHFRYFMRQITRHTLLYTEMVTSGAILHGDREKILGVDPQEKPLGLQIGGDNPKELGACARIAEDLGFDEVNLNVGCPSERVQNGNFGACLMTAPEIVAEAVHAMKQSTHLPITVKHRIGVDDQDDYEFLYRFVRIVSKAGCDRFIIHARKAWLKGLSPKANRTIPPLRYDFVYQLKKDFPHLNIVVNGGIHSIEDMRHHLKFVDGVMVGRAAYENPFLFSLVDQVFYGSQAPPPSRFEVIEKMVDYIERWRQKGLYPNHILRHMHGLFAYQRGTRAWKRYLSEHGHLPGTTGQILYDACRNIPEEILHERPEIPVE